MREIYDFVLVSYASVELIQFLAPGWVLVSFCHFSFFVTLLVVSCLLPQSPLWHDDSNVALGIWSISMDCVSSSGN